MHQQFSLCYNQASWSPFEIKNQLFKKMKNSGYNEKFRQEVMKISVNGYEKILEDGENGVKPVYRNKECLGVN